MPRPRTLGLIAAVLLLLVVIGLLVALPGIVRRVAVDRLTKTTGRAVTLDAVHLNLFTGRVALDRFRLAQRGSANPALEVEGLELRVSVPSLLTKHVRVASVTLTAPRVHVARLTPTEFDFSDLLALIPPADPNAKPSTRTVAVDSITLTRGAVVARDGVTGATWTLEDLNVDGAALTTRAGPPGRLTVKAKLNGTPLTMDAQSIDVATGVAAARVTIEGFDVALARPYVPGSLGISPVAGRVTVALDVKVEKATPTPRVLLTGEAKLDGVAIHTANAPEPFVKIGKVVVSIKEAQPLAGTLALDTVTIDGADVKVKRDAQGRIDLLSPASPGADVGSAAPAALPAPPTAPRLTVSVRELSLRGTTVTLRDETVNATLALTDVSATVRDVTWPGSGPLSFDVATGMPGAGRLAVKGTATLSPVTAEFTMSMRGAPIEPYQPYLPIPGRLVGTFNGESRSRVSLADGKLVMAVSQGKSWIDGLELREPGGTVAPVKIARVMIDGIDFTHPGRAAAKVITVTKPQLRVERDANGNINIRKLFAAETPPITTTNMGGSGRPPSPPALGAPRPSRGAPRQRDSFTGSETKGPGPGPAGPEPFVSPMPLEIGAFVIEDGDARFIDRTTTPAFSETITRLAVRVDGLSSQPGRRAKVGIQAIVGGDSALDLKGEVAPFGDLYADVAGELRGFALPTVNPYADSALAWIIERGKVTAKLHYTVERNQLTAKNEIIVENLHVARSRSDDEVQKRIGLPLGMIVALITDSDNSIRVNLPLTGTLQSWSADLSDAIWTVVRNAVVNIVAAPFKAIGRMFTGKGDKIESLAVDPTPFAAGSATVAPEAEGHLTKVADFLRRSPGIKLTLAPVTTPADAESLRAQELTVRLQRVQREAKLADLEAAIAAEFARVFPGETPPKTTEERVARLRAREPVSPEALDQLATRRLEAVREALAAKEGIPPARLVAGTPASASSGDGRVEFTIVQ
jgi:uncharacterized protein involved in outer membrane biogenesis